MVIKTFEAFAGYGSQLMALKRLEHDYPEVQFEPIGISEIDENPIKAYKAVHGDITNYGDISKIDWNNVPDFDLFTYSFPCFVKGTLVMTSAGFKCIEDITSNDMVITHTNSFHKVVKPMHRVYNGEIYTIKGMSFKDIKCTDEHPFYVRKKTRVGHKQERLFLSPEWVKAKDLNKDYYLGLAINPNSELPKWEGSIDNRWGHGNQVNKLENLLTNTNFWYVMGRYVGDGWCVKKTVKKNTGSGIIICCGGRNEEKLVSALNACNFHIVKSEDKHTRRYQVMLNELCNFVERYGYYAHGKKIDIETLNLPTELLSSFMNGYIDSDGSFDGKYYQIGTVSEELAYGIVQAVAKVYHRPSSLHFTKKMESTIIEGREVHQRDIYTVVWKLSTDIQDKAFYDGGYVWMPIIDIESENTTCDVYNMEVDTDNSYTANGIIVHNCQDISSAGYQKGFAEGSDTRSGLLWECAKAIIAKRPKYLLMENVKALCNKKFMPDFQKWLDFLAEQGYSSKWQVLNSKKYGIPQNRERTFCVSILGDDTYQFPEPFELKKHIKDILENPLDPDSFYNNDYLQNLHWFDNSGKAYKNDSIIKLGNMFPSNHQSGTIYDINGCCGTIMLHHGTGTLVAIPDNNGGYKVKKLSTREMFRGMGVSDEDIDKMISAVGKTAAWKLAGNSIVVDTLYHIFKTMFVK